MGILDIFREPKPEQPDVFKPSPYSALELLRDGQVPSITIGSAEGETTYPGFTDDEASRIAKRYIMQRLAEHASEHPSE